MDDDLVAEINERFGAGKELNEDVVLELQSIAKIHGLSVEDMFWKWESYCMKLDKPDMKVNMTTTRAFKQDLQDALERRIRSHPFHTKTEKKVTATPRAAAMGGDVFGMLVCTSNGLGLGL